jgi:hypothetical protein
MTDPSLLLERRHLTLGWYTLLAYACIGVALELLHAFKVGFYLDVDSETRRLMWRLAHAHGALLGLVNVVFALTLRTLVRAEAGTLRLASSCLAAACLVLPLGFLLGGVFANAADPGLPILLVPMGAVLLIAGLSLLVRSLRH